MRLPMLMAFGALALAPARSDAQVSGTIVIGGGPVAGVITIGEPRRSARRVVVVERYAPRVIVVERIHRRKDRRHPVFRHRAQHDRGFVYYDRRGGAYYDRAYRRGLVEVPVIRYRGRYYVVVGR